MTRLKLLVLAAACAAALTACKTSLKEERWRDTYDAPSQSWLTPGEHRLAFGRVLNVQERGVRFQELRYGLMIDAVDPENVAASELTARVDGGRRYRIVKIECSPSYAACPMMKTNTELYLTPLRATRTPLVAGERARTFDALYVAITGGSMRTQGPFERLID